jgi:hypothetical protein
MAKGVNSSKMKFFNAVAHLKPGLVELSYTFDQGGQTCVHRWFSSLSLDDLREQKFVLPWRLDMHINRKPFLLWMFPTTFEEC